MKKDIIKSITILLLFIAASFTIFMGAGNKGKGSTLVARRVPPSSYKKSANDMIVSFVDVGQGNCVLVQTPSGATLLYDAGGNPEWMQSTWDPGLQIVAPYLEKRNVEKINYAVMSHAHGDHIGGYKSILYNFKVETFIDPGYAYGTVLYKSLLETVKAKEITYQLGRDGGESIIDLGPDITCRILSPPGGFYFAGTNSDCNNSSILLKITYKNVSFLLTGDLESRGEVYCAKKYSKELASNVLQVGHHGSYTSSTSVFLEKVQPEIAVIPVGENNTFGHPSADALSNLESVGAEIYRTDFDGNVMVFTDGKTFIVETDK
ncbi:ComEC/Rec2 family competence protein [Elusimicrobiota bacterium]